jgi:hypothetical protein
VTDIDQSTESNCQSNDPLIIPFGDFFKPRIVLPADEHVAIYIHEDVADVGAHFERLAKVCYNYYFVVLNDIGLANRRAKVSSLRINAAVYWIK